MNMEPDNLDGLRDLILRTAMRISPNKDADGIIPFIDSIYVTPITGKGSYRPSGGVTRAKFYICIGELDTPGVDPYCIMYPLNAYRYGWSFKKGHSLWKMSDRAVARMRAAMWNDFGIVLS